MRAAILFIIFFGAGRGSLPRVQKPLPWTIGGCRGGVILMVIDVLLLLLKY